LFEMSCKQPHPELGGGLLCLLHLPHHILDEARLHQVCEELNNRELEAADQPPHFGAWCPGRVAHGLAHVTFLPNALHRVEGIAANVAIWAMHRSHWADQLLATMGIEL